MTRHSSPISGVACSPRGYVATAGYDNQIILWQQRRPIARAWHDHLANQCDFSHDGTLLVTSSSDYTARVWTVPDLRLHSVLGSHDDDVEMAVFSPDARLVATASRDHCLRVFDVSGSLVRKFAGHQADVISVTWNPNGKQLITSSDDGTVRRWCMDSGHEVESVDMDGVETDTVVIGADGAVFAGNDRGEIHVLRGSDRHVVDAHSAGVKRLALSKNGKLLASASYDRSLLIWRVERDRLDLAYRTEVPPEAWIRSVAFDHDEKLIVGTFGSCYARYDPAESHWDMNGVSETHGINAVCFGQGTMWTIGDAGIVRRAGTIVQRVGSLCNFLLHWQGRLLTGGHLGQLIDALTGQVLLTHTSPLNCATLLPDGDAIIGTYTGEGLQIGQDADSATVFVRRTLRLHDQAIKGVSANGRHLFSISADGSGAYHDAHTGELVRMLPLAHRKIANGVCVLRDGRFASVSRDLQLRIWGEGQVREIPSPHDHSIKCVAVTRDGRWLGTGSYNGLVAFYDLERSCWGNTIRPTFAGISCLSSCDEDGCLLASSYDGKVYRVSVASAFAPSEGT